ncbi:metal-binding protein [Serinibacter arcticus]|uniref:Metal-binding protein n=2 Tax=Serinibacter arcticus TaxID=1655435 RepID=A0A2U1ZZ30_9MICO|nr:metal-binding protein [Serinibacter arcticus]
MRTLELEVPAPADLAIEVIGVPEGAPVELDLRLESVLEGVLVTASAHAPLVGECVRCLGEVTDTVDVSFSELYAYPGAIEKHPDDEEAEFIAEMTGDAVDLEQSLRDAVVLALPFQPYCRPDCAGLCAQCGKNLNEDPHDHDLIDIRWASLKESLEAGDDDGDEAPASPPA